jgi:DNA helicase-2/ATP-dependent DNA helicase PcrA
MEGAILAAELIAFLLQPKLASRDVNQFVELLCNFFLGKGGGTPTKKDIAEAQSIDKALQRAIDCKKSGKNLPNTSIIRPVLSAYQESRSIEFCGDPVKDWLAVRVALENSGCKRLQQVTDEARNIRLLDRGTQLREALSQTWRDTGEYVKALDIVRQAFVQQHFSTSMKPESGVIVMNMHKAKGKQFDEVIIFEGWPRIYRGEIKGNPGRIVRGNRKDQDLTQARLNFRVSVTRAKSKTTIMTPKNDPCVLLLG